jgi:hypothetical protein
LAPAAEARNALRCGHVHPPTGGSLDESARRLSHQELAVATALAAEGHAVRSLPERRGGGRNPDLAVCASNVEVKSFDPAADRCRPPSRAGVVNKLIDGAGQADQVVLVANGSGLDLATVRQGLAHLAALERRDVAVAAMPRLSAVRVMGDGWDLAWSRAAMVERSQTVGADRVDGRARPPAPEVTAGSVVTARSEVPGRRPRRPSMGLGR